MRMEQYDMNIKYVPDCDVKLADPLSGVNPRRPNTGRIRVLVLSVHEVHLHLNASPTRIGENPIVRKLINISSGTAINHLKGIFDERGIPERLISDNGTLYSFGEFRVFGTRYGLITSQTHQCIDRQWIRGANSAVSKTTVHKG